MSAPVLSPAEQAEATRFGIHDEEILRDIEERLDDDLRCTVGECEAAATVRVLHRCCAHMHLVCDPHLARARRGWALNTAFVARTRCEFCGALTSMPRTFNEMFRVVPL